MNVRAAVSAQVVRAAVYTRKSSDEGLEQSFNSLHAQREACEAYVKSQAHEGWRCLPTLYDDGGFSGGSMERPALKQLLADIAAGEVDTVVVYKIDRLTRSLADFARIVEAFDGAGVSFVSVTQAFNTTTSMGRLTLNVLLSFAQFEREVTGERIRDKIALSKARGMWMGGVLPLGYDAGDHVLVVNEPEAEQVRAIFRRYLKVGSVHRLRDELERTGVRSKAWTTTKGRPMGGQVITRGALYHLLQNPHYAGRIRHRDTSYEGLHPAIVDAKLFEAVQRELGGNRVKRRERPTAVGDAPLGGKIFDEQGRPYSPTFSCGRGGRRYAYYVQSELQQGRPADSGAPARLPARALEEALHGLVVRLGGPQAAGGRDPGPTLLRVELRPQETRITLDAERLFGLDHPDLAMEDLRGRLESGERAALAAGDPATVTVVLPMSMQFRGGRIWSSNAPRPPRKDETLIRALKDAHRLMKQHGLHPGAVSREGRAPISAYERRVCLLALLDPDIQEAILAGRQPRVLSLAGLLDRDLPLLWSDQRRLLGFSSAPSA